MLRSDFRKSAENIAARNPTPNIAAVAASRDASENHVHVICYLGSPTDDDEDWRELIVSELVGAFPTIQTASSALALPRTWKRLNVPRGPTSDRI